MDWSVWGPVFATAGGTALGAYVTNKNANAARDQQAQQFAQGQLFSEQQALRNTALEESLADPYRQQMNQAKDLTALDVIARARNTPVSISVPGKYASYVPTISGGFNYDMSPDMREAAKRIQRSVASGETAPTMTNPANYGRTAALNLVNPGAPAAGNAAADLNGATSTSGASTPAGSTNTDLTSSVFGAKPGSVGYSADPEDIAMDAQSKSPYYQNYRRRKQGSDSIGGDAMKGASMGSVAGPFGMAGGAVVGGIVGAARKHAPSAYSDFYLDDARQILRDASKNELGRQLPDSAIDQALQGQGLQQGDEWVGQQSLDYIIQQLKQSPEAQQRRAQLASGLQPSYSGLFAA